MDVSGSEVVRLVSHRGELASVGLNLILFAVDSLEGHEVGAVRHSEVASQCEVSHL